MDISFKPGLNIVCGPNGVGKTTILDAIGSIFVAHYNLEGVRRRAGANAGYLDYSVILDDEFRDGGGTIKNFDPTDFATPYGNDVNSAAYLIYVKSNRDFGYTRLDGVLRDPHKQRSEYQQSATNGISVIDVKQWFGNRYLMEPHGERWPQYQRQNLSLAKTFFSLLDSEVSLSHVDSSTFEVLLNTPSGTIPFEYMSAGFRTSYSLILGILKEIEFRRLNVSAEQFTGVILVDELDLHLHPTWHGPMLRALEAAYPSAQIIVTTHSPHMIQNASSEQLIILAKSQSTPRRLNGVDRDFGLIGWTVEEILRDIMGMEDPRPPRFAEMMQRYETAVTRRDIPEIEASKADVLRALHPSSVMRQIIEIESL